MPILRDTKALFWLLLEYLNMQFFLHRRNFQKHHQCVKDSSRTQASNHGPHEADSPQVHRRKGPSQAAGHKGSSQVSSGHRRSQEASQVCQTCCQCCDMQSATKICEGPDSDV